jgi:uncharacterized membrane protein
VHDVVAFLKTWAIVCLVTLPIDFLWLRGMGWFYRRELGDMLLTEPRLGIAGLFYVVFAAGLAWFAILPNLGAGVLAAALSGAFLGFVAYSTYDATNYATLKGFPLSVTVVDWLWGTTLGFLGAGLGAAVIKRFGIV